MSTPIPGWYPDPADPSGQRYWDGSAWTEHTAPGAPYPVRSDRGSKVVVIAVLAVVAALVLVIGGAAALILTARDDDSGPIDPTISTVILPTTIVAGPEGGSTDGQGQAGDAAQMSECQVERATVSTAIEAAKLSSQASGTVESPDDYLADPAGLLYYSWTGATPEEWTLQPIGSPPC